MITIEIMHLIHDDKNTGIFCYLIFELLTIKFCNIEASQRLCTSTTRSFSACISTDMKMADMKMADIKMADMKMADMKMADMKIGSN